MGARLGAGRGQPWAVALASFVLLQSAAAVFFVADVVADLRSEPLGAHSILEAAVVLALICGVALSIAELRSLYERLGEQERTIALARGELAKTIAHQFETWGLTPAEADVGLLALKGLDVAEIAGIRGSAQGTVRSQLTRIYAKAGVSGRAQFAAWFVEDLLSTGTGHATGPATPAAASKSEASPAGD